MTTQTIDGVMTEIVEAASGMSPKVDYREAISWFHPDDVAVGDSPDSGPDSGDSQAGVSPAPAPTTSR